MGDEKSELEACVASKPEYGIAYLYLAKNIMDGGGDLLQAKQFVEKGLQNLTEKSQAPLGHYLLADIYNRLGDSHQANIQVQLARQAESK
jgi:Tfp pilus assembly protein PilF